MSPGRRAAAFQSNEQGAKSEDQSSPQAGERPGQEWTKWGFSKHALLDQSSQHQLTWYLESGTNFWAFIN